MEKILPVIEQFDCLVDSTLGIHGVDCAADLTPQCRPSTDMGCDQSLHVIQYVQAHIRFFATEPIFESRVEEGVIAQGFVKHGLRGNDDLV